MTWKYLWNCMWGYAPLETATDHFVHYLGQVVVIAMVTGGTCLYFLWLDWRQSRKDAPKGEFP